MRYPKQPMLLATMLLLACRTGYAEVLHELDFSKAHGDVKTWFESRGWKSQGKILKMNPRFEDVSLVLEAMHGDSGTLLYEFSPAGFLTNASHIAIEWGVEQHPVGADWNGPKTRHRNTREAISVMISFGTEKIGSGKLLVPGAPYFISLFPADGETCGHAYYGNYWQKGGRYFCVSGDGTTDPITTRFALTEKFMETFEIPAPPVTGLAIEVDAKHTTKVGGRHSKAYIRKIIILDGQS